jgi:CelD/BcsL family acetyltransferase involved in cellulose biosynthesis
MGYRASVITPGNLDELRNVWESLSPKVERIAFYHSWEWIDGVAKYLYPDSLQLAFFIIWDGAIPVALFPLELKERRLLGIIPDTEINNLSHAHMPFNDWLCASDHDPAEVLGVLLASLDSFASSPWCRLKIHSVLDDTPLASAVTRYRNQSSSGQRSYYFDCEDTSIEAILSSHQRRNLRRRRKQADKLGVVTFEYVKASEGGVFTEALEAFFRLEASGWKGSDGQKSAISLSPSLSGFYQNLASANHSRYFCQINLMKIDGNPVAGQYCFIADGVAHLIKIGFDENLKHCSPGSLLLKAFLERSVQQKDIQRVSLVTAPQWADRWHPEKLESQSIRIFNNTLPASMQMFVAGARKSIGRVMINDIAPVFNMLRKTVFR